MKFQKDFLALSQKIFSQYRTMGERAMAQVGDDKLFILPSVESNSIAIIVKHLQGNMLSRWSDFLTTDGEKEWRNRDAEFENTLQSRQDVMQLWNEGWNCLENTLNSLTENDMEKKVLIRGEEHTVMEAINRQIAHYAYHIGQIVFLCRMYTGEWETLSIAKNKSKEFNQKMMNK